MNNSALELIAPRLEQNIIEYYKRLKFDRASEEGNFEDHQKALDQELKQKLISYFDDWRILMVAYGGKYTFSFWVDTFYCAYSSVLLEAGVPFFAREGSITASSYIDQILIRLNKLFRSTSFVESLHHRNQLYAKRIDKIRESYCTVSEIYPNAVDLKFELSLDDPYNQWVDILKLLRMFNSFQKMLKQLYWYGSQAVFTFYQVVRVDQRYVIQFFITLNPSLCVEHAAYSHQIDYWWKVVTKGMGIISCPKLNFQQYQYENELIIQHNTQALDPLSALDGMPDRETSIDGLANRVCVYPRGFKWFHGAPIRR